MTFKAYFLLSGLFLFWCIPGIAHADTFTPHSIISDEELQDHTAMVHEDIQAFLIAKNSFLANFTTEDASGTPRLPAEIIARTAQTYHINPKYLLVKLQKEQSLITAKNPTQKQLDWATGYGICDSCSMSDPTLQKYRGFGNQVDYAAGIMRWYYDHVADESWIKRPGTSYTIDNTEVTPQNYATAFLYTYTPHIEGNQNFWNLWNRWFQHSYPNGTLLKVADSPVVYRLSDGQKRPFASMTALLSRADPAMIITVTPDELTRYETGNAIKLPNYSILFDGTTYYLLDDDVMRPFESEQVVRGLGFHPDETITITPEERMVYEIGEPIVSVDTAPTGRVVRLKETQQLYFLKDGVIRPILHEAIAKKNFPNLPIESVTQADVMSFTRGHAVPFRDGTLFGVIGSPYIYVAEFGAKRHIPSEEVFLGLGYKWSQVVWIDEFAELIHPTGQPLSLPREVANNEVPLVTSPTQDEPAGPTTNDLMFRTPKDKTVTTGPVFATEVNSYVVMNAKTGEILATKNADDVRPLASLTKVVTAYELLNEGIDLTKSTVYVPAKHDAKYGTFRVAPGEAIANTDLFDSMLISSINTAARMLASTATGGEKGLIARANTNMKTLGLQSMAFVDPAGIELENKGTAKEYAQFFAKAITNPELVRMMSQTEYDYMETLDLDLKPRHFDSHTNELVGDAKLPYTILASKTGYLDEAGANLALYVRRPSDDATFIIVTLGNPNYGERFKDPDALTRFALNTF